MKKFIFLICLMSFLLVGFDYDKDPASLGLCNQNYFDLTNHEYDGEAISMVYIPNSVVKHNKLAGKSEGKNTDIYWNKYTNTYLYNRLSYNQQQYWDNLDLLYMSYIMTDKDYKRESVTAVNMEAREAFNLSFMYLYAHPQFFFLKPRLHGFAYKKNNISYINIDIDFYDKFKSGKDRLAAATEIRNTFDKWVKEVNTCSSDYYKYKKINDIICDYVEYDNPVAEDNYDWDNDPNFSQSIYSGVHTKKTVCAGYAKMYTCLASMAGLNGIALCGSGHAWNLVQLDKQWFLVDATWGDALFNYKYFLVDQHAFNDQYHTASTYWDDVTEPAQNYCYHDFKVVNGVTYYGEPYIPFDGYSIDYVLGGNNKNNYYLHELMNLPAFSLGGTKRTFPNIKRTGYKFLGWYLDGKKVKTVKKKFEDLTLEAHWQPITYNISFKKNAKKAKGTMKNMTKIEYDTTVTLPKNCFTYEGHKFKGWSLTKKGDVILKDEQTVTNLTMFNSTVKLYAIWE